MDLFANDEPSESVNRHWLISLILSLVCVFAITVLGVVVASGEPVSMQGNGILLDESASKKVAEGLRDLSEQKAIAETQAAQISSLQTQVEALQETIKQYKEAENAKSLALAIADDREKRRKDDEERLLTVLREMKDVLKESRVALDKANERIDKLENRVFWSSILGPLSAILGFVAGAL